MHTITVNRVQLSADEFTQKDVFNIFFYREGDIVKQPMKKGSFMPKNVPGVGWGGVGWDGS